MSAAGLVSLLVFAWAATGVMTSIRQGLERAMGVTEGRPAARGKLVDLVLVIGTAVLVLVTAGLTVLDSVVERAAGRVADVLGLPTTALAETILHLSFFALSVVVVLLLYRFVPARGISLRDGIVGAIVTASLLQAISLASSLILDKTNQLSVIYGTLTAALVFVYSMYLYSSALLLGAEVARAWTKPEGPPGEPLGTQVKRAILGLFVSAGSAAAAASGRRTAPVRPRRGGEGLGQFRLWLPAHEQRVENHRLQEQDRQRPQRVLRAPGEAELGQEVQADDDDREPARPAGAREEPEPGEDQHDAPRSS